MECCHWSCSHSMLTAPKAAGAQEPAAAAGAEEQLTKLFATHDSLCSLAQEGKNGKTRKATDGATQVILPCTLTSHTFGACNITLHGVLSCQAVKAYSRLDVVLIGACTLHLLILILVIQANSRGLTCKQGPTQKRGRPANNVSSTQASMASSVAVTASAFVCTDMRTPVLTVACLSKLLHAMVADENAAAEYMEVCFCICATCRHLYLTPGLLLAGALYVYISTNFCCVSLDAEKAPVCLHCL